MHLSTLTIPLLIAWLSWTSLAHAGDVDGGQALQPSETKGFLSAVEGHWRGRAVVTPVGPLPYDIDFQHTAANTVKGAADPGAAIHHWLFSAQGETLRLRFLTTFEGNTKPIFLTAATRAGNRFVFNAEHRVDLTVSVTPDPETIIIEVLLRGDAHILIKLRRTASAAR